MNIHPEAAREVPIVEECDVLVCGGGPAGFAAALAAARGGAKTVLLETQGFLGGVWTAGLLSYVLDCGDKSGVMPELIARLEDSSGARIERERADYPWVAGSFCYDPEDMKLTLEQMCVEAGVLVRLYTRVVAAARDENNKLAIAITESKSGREAWAAKVFIDCSGDGDLAFHAGCGFDLGDETGKAQPMTLMCLITGIEREDAGPFSHVSKSASTPPSQLLHDAMKNAGKAPSYSSPHLFRIRDDLYALMANHQYGASGLDANELTRATMEARAEVHGIVKALRKSGGVWRNLQLVATGAHIGVREGRRVHGRYTITREDLIAGRRHEDAICRVNFPVDVHSPDPKSGKGFGNAGIKSKPYDVPLRALIARDCDGLLMAGRCISGDFWAHASYRVTGNAVAMGEATGKLSALAARLNLLPHEIAWPDFKAATQQETA